MQGGAGGREGRGGEEGKARVPSVAHADAGVLHHPSQGGGGGGREGGREGGGEPTGGGGDHGRSGGGGRLGVRVVWGRERGEERGWGRGRGAAGSLGEVAGRRGGVVGLTVPRAVRIRVSLALATALAAAAATALTDVAPLTPKGVRYKGRVRRRLIEAGVEAGLSPSYSMVGVGRVGKVVFRDLEARLWGVQRSVGQRG